MGSQIPPDQPGNDKSYDDPNALRTHYRQLVWHKNDAWAGLALLIVTVGLVCIRIFF